MIRDVADVKGGSEVAPPIFQRMYPGDDRGGETQDSSLGWGWGTEFGSCRWWIFLQVTGLNTHPFQLTVEKLEMALEGVNSEVWGFSQIQGWEWVGPSRD